MAPSTHFWFGEGLAAAAGSKVDLSVGEADRCRLGDGRCFAGAPGRLGPPLRREDDARRVRRRAGADAAFLTWFATG
jgi:hypothetical protein